MPDPTAVDVYASINGDNLLAGRLHSHHGRRAETATFTYSDGYLADPRAYALEPGLPLFSGAQHTPVGLALFRSFADSSPDRWGRRLITHAERIRAQQSHATARTLSSPTPPAPQAPPARHPRSEFTYLLGVRDDLRQGALRFAQPGTTAFLADDETGVPALTDLPKLLDLADRAETDTADYDDLRALLRAGSSLGGARPKAHVRTDEGQVAIAKFPSTASDTWNVMAWEKTAFDLARDAGITVPPSRLLRIGGRDIHIIDRFDRSNGTRIGYVSAMTMLEAQDGDTGSYLDIAAIIEEHSRATTTELRQLWKRIVFSILISNTDDHLRNHGFLHRSGDSWTLSPAFDLNPDPSPGTKYLSTAIDNSDTTASIALALQVASLFRLSDAHAAQTLSEVRGATRRWAHVAAANGLTARDITNMAPAFEHPEAAAAQHHAQHARR